jgi:hypothetical protein
MVDRNRKGNPPSKRHARSRPTRNQLPATAEEDDSNPRGVTLTATPHANPTAHPSSDSLRASSTGPSNIDGTASNDGHSITSVSRISSAFYFPSPGGPLVEAWDNDLSYATGIGPFYEPQGELASPASESHQQQRQHNPSFSFPLQLSPGFSSEQSLSPSLIFTTSNPETPLFQQHHQPPPAIDPVVSAAGAQAKNTVGDLITDPSAMATTAARPRAGMKRKASSVQSPDPVSIYFGHASGSGHASSSRSSAAGIMQVPIPGVIAAPSIPEGEQSIPIIAVEGPKNEESMKRAKGGSEIIPRLSPTLPAGKVFPIRIGSELFHLSGASISSDCMLLWMVELT